MENDQEVSKSQKYMSTLREVTEVFESCGCSTEVVTPGPGQSTLIIRGQTSFCPAAIFEEHVEKAKDLMQNSHPEVAFQIEIDETT
jgi:hypothetical protein